MNWASCSFFCFFVWCVKTMHTKHEIRKRAQNRLHKIWFNLIKILMKVHYIGRVSWVNLKLSTFCYFHLGIRRKTNISTSTHDKTLCHHCHCYWYWEVGNIVHVFVFVNLLYISPPFQAYICIVVDVAVAVVLVRVAIELSMARQFCYLCKIYFVN